MHLFLGDHVACDAAAKELADVDPGAPGPCLQAATYLVLCAGLARAEGRPGLEEDYARRALASSYRALHADKIAELERYLDRRCTEL